MNADSWVRRRPGRALGWAITIALVAAWSFLRLGVFDTVSFPLTYLLPMLVCVWTMNRGALWFSAATFLVLHSARLYSLLPPGEAVPDAIRTNFIGTVLNLTSGGIAVHAIIALRTRLEAALDDIRAKADELSAQAEELTQQNEELAVQGEELASQGEELQAQNEELQAQTEEIASLNESLGRREQLLEALVEIARLSPTEDVALERIARAGSELFVPDVAAAALFERDEAGLVRRACVCADGSAGVAVLPAEALIELVVDQGRTAAIDHLAMRPDLVPSQAPAWGAVLAAPIPGGDRTAGAFAVYMNGAHQWTGEEFRLAEWIAGHSGRILLALRLQAALRESDRRKDEFLATLSHELRNPLAPMRFALELLESGRNDGGQPLSVLKRQFEQLVRLVDDLLEASRLTSNKIQLQKTRVDLAAVVRHAVEGCRPHLVSARHALTLNLPDEPVWVDADAARLAQVVTNLVNNAIRYTPSGGAVTVSLAGGDDEAVVSVADNGRGLERGDLERVFEMFTQVGGPGSDGLGIGLALVRAIVELHGGRVEARSDGPGRGSEFRVTLSRMARPHQPDAVCVPAAAGPTRRVLVVDDNTDAAAMIGALLEQQGHEVRIAHTAESALAISREFRAEVALLDIGLPGMDGYALARQLRTRHDGAMRLVALTGWGQDGDRERARAAGFDAHLTKPADLRAVLEVMHG